MRKTMAPFFWYRSAWRLDGLAFGCYPNLYDIETFDVNDGVFGRDTHLIDLENGLDVGIGTAEPTRIPDLKSRWVDVSKVTEPLPDNPPNIRRRLEAQGYGTGALIGGERWPPIEWLQQPEANFGAASTTSSGWHEGWFSAIARSNEDGVLLGTVRIFERAGIDLRHLPASTATASFEFRYFMATPNRGGLRLQARPRGSPNWQTPWIYLNNFTNTSGRVEVDLLGLGLGGQVIDIRIVATNAALPAGNIVVDGFRIRTSW